MSNNIEQAAIEAAEKYSIEDEDRRDYYEGFLAGSIHASTASQGLNQSEVLKEIIHHLDTWSDEPDRAVRLVRKTIERAESESTPTDDRAAPDYPTYEQAGGNKTWDDMTELEKAYYDIRKLHNALAMGKNHIQSLRKKADDRAAHAMAFAEWKTKEGWYLRSDSNTWKNDNFDLSYSIDDVYALWPDRDKVEGQAEIVHDIRRVLNDLSELTVNKNINERVRDHIQEIINVFASKHPTV